MPTINETFGITPNSGHRPRVPTWIPLTAAGIAVIVALAVINPFFTVGQRERAVVTSFGAFSRVAGPGLNLRIPLVNSVKEFSVAQQQLEVKDAETFTVDNQMVKVDFVVLYEIADGNVERIFREVPNYENRLRNLALDRMKSVLGQRNIAELPQQRGAITAEIIASLKTAAETLLGLTIIDFQLVDVEYSLAYRQAVDQSAVAKARVEQVEQERRQAEVMGATLQIQAVASANQAIERARGESEARRLQAIAEAQAVRLRGEAEASSISAQTRALSENPDYIRLRQAERWDGRLPIQLLGSAPIPFIDMSEPSRVPAGERRTSAAPLALPAPSALPALTLAPRQAEPVPR